MPAAFSRPFHPAPDGSSTAPSTLASHRATIARSASSGRKQAWPLIARTAVWLATTGIDEAASRRSSHEFRELA
jgi:hypothetical protein